MRLSLGVCSGTFHSNSQPRKPTASNYCRLVDIFCSYNLTTCAYHYLRFTRPWGLLMTAAFRKGPGVSIADINSKHSRLSRSQLQQANFPHTLKGKKPTNTQRTRCTAFLIITGRMTKWQQISHHTSQNGHPHKSTSNKCRREPAGEGAPIHSWWERTFGHSH